MESTLTVVKKNAPGLTNSSKSKILSIEYLRGIASVMVLFHHINIELNANQILERIFFEARLGVQTFFLISGFVIPLSLWTTGYKIRRFFKFLLRRSVRIDPPIWIVILLIFLFGTSYNYCNNIKFQYITDFRHLLLNLFYLVPFFSNTCWYDNVFWTLGIEFQFYILIGITFPFLTQRIGSLIYITSLFIFWLIYMFNHTQDQQYITSHLVFFTIGITGFLFQVKVISFIDTLILMLLFSWGIFQIHGITHVLLVNLVFILIFTVKAKSQIGASLAKISFSLYLTHPIVLYLTSSIVEDVYAMILLQTMSSIIVAAAFHYTVEKIFLGLSKKIPLQ